MKNTKPFDGPWFCACDSEHFGYIFDVSKTNMLGKHSPQGDYYFAAFTRSLDAERYIQALRTEKVVR